ncbi:uncharacterized protein [Bemisia tabaci]|uniref:uncharacterized protein n=1 Tax=Bemisia tabaci TaxID=7038 RepID=UPI003B28286B
MKLSALYLQLSTLLQSLWNSDSSSLKNSRIQREQPMESSEEIKWTLMPDGRGDVRVAILDGLLPGSEPDVQDSVKFLLYTRQNTKKPEVGKMNSTCRPVFKYFNSKRQSKILIHGFGDDSTSSLMYPVLTEGWCVDIYHKQISYGACSAVLRKNTV